MQDLLRRTGPEGEQGGRTPRAVRGQRTKDTRPRRNAMSLKALLTWQREATLPLFVSGVRTWVVGQRTWGPPWVPELRGGTEPRAQLRGPRPARVGARAGSSSASDTPWRLVTEPPWASWGPRRVDSRAPAATVLTVAFRDNWFLSSLQTGAGAQRPTVRERLPWPGDRAREVSLCAATTPARLLTPPERPIGGSVPRRWQ